MTDVDDLVAAISALQRSDLETWIREELVVPRQEAGARFGLRVGEALVVHDHENAVALHRGLPAQQRGYGARQVAGVCCSGSHRKFPVAAA